MGCYWILTNGLKIQWAIISTSWDTATTKTFSNLGWVSYTTSPVIQISDYEKVDQSGSNAYQSFISSVSSSQVTFRSFATKISLLAIGY